MSTASIITTGPCATRPPAVRPPPFIAGHDAAEPVTIAARTPWAALILTGAIGGVLSGLFAIGGAILMVPLLVWRAGMDQRRAAATSLVAIIPTAVASSATYLAHADVDIVAAGLIAGNVVAQVPPTSAEQARYAGLFAAAVRGDPNPRRRRHASR